MHNHYYTLLFALLLTTSLTAQNRAYYVSPDGNNAATGEALDVAWATIEYGLATITPGDTLLVNDGLYVETDLKITQRSTAGRPTVVKSINQWGAKIQSNRQYATILEADSAAYVVIDGFEVFNPDNRPYQDWNSGINAYRSHHVTIINNYSHDCGCGGIGGRESDYLIIRRNVTRDNAKTNPYNCSGISIYQPTQLDDAPGTHILIAENVCFENECRLPFTPLGFDRPTDGNGIILDDFNWTQGLGDGPQQPPYTAEVIVENNLSFNNGGAGMKAYEAANAIFRNNTSVNNNLVLHEYTEGLGEIAGEAVIGDVAIYNNVIVQGFGQQGFAVHWQPTSSEATLEVFNNIIVGDERYNREPEEMNNVRTNYDERGFPRFAQIVPDDFEFTSVDDFRQFFGLRADSPGIGLGQAELAPMTDLNGNIRPTGGSVDAGAFQGAVDGVGPIAADRVFTNDIPQTHIPVEVNGFKDQVYRTLPRRIERLTSGSVANDADLVGRWAGAWDDTYLYLFVEVEDNRLRNNSTDPSEDDGVEIFIDADNSRGASYDGVNDFHYVLGWNDDGVIERALDATEGVLVAQSSGFDGYAKEIAIPWTTLGITPGADALLGLDFWVNDDDNEGGLEGRMTWQDRENTAPAEPAVLGNGRLTSSAAPVPVHAVRTGESITIDGEPEDTWWGATKYDIGNLIDGATDGAEDLSGTWQALYSPAFLYLYVTVVDDALRNNSADYFNDDAVELFLDGGLECNDEYDANDKQLGMLVNSNSLVATQGSLGQGVLARSVITEEGYDVEMRLPWAVIGGSATEGRLLGLDVQLTDDDDVSSADARLGWFATEGGSDENPNLFGLVYLAEAAPTATVDAAVAQPLGLYPNPAAETVRLDLPTAAEHIEVLDLNGRRVLTAGATTTLDVSGLPSGSYVVSAVTADGIYRGALVVR